MVDVDCAGAVRGLRGQVLHQPVAASSGKFRVSRVIGSGTIIHRILEIVRAPPPEWLSGSSQPTHAKSCAQDGVIAVHVRTECAVAAFMAMVRADALAASDLSVRQERKPQTAPSSRGRPRFTRVGQPATTAFRKGCHFLCPVPPPTHPSQTITSMRTPARAIK
jgi:hypothetical protein